MSNVGTSNFKHVSLLAIWGLCTAAPVSADTISVNDITGTGARNFSDASIWPPLPGVPDADDFPVIDSGDGTTDYVFIDVDTEVQRINIGNTISGGLEIRSGATLTTNATGGSQSNIGPNGTGHLRILSGATLDQGGLLFLGLGAGNGMVTLENNATHKLGGALAIRDGTGSYDMQGGSLTIGGFFQMARNGNATFTQADGTLQVNNGVSTQYGMYIALGNPGATGLYEISGGSLTVGGTNLGVVNGNPLGGALGTFRIVGSDPSVTILSDYEQNPDARFEVVVDSGGISPMNVGGDVSLDGGLGVSFTTVPTSGEQFTIMNYAGNLTGMFSDFDNMVDSPLGPDSVRIRVGYGTGMDSSVVLTVVPEPSTIALLVCGMGLVFLARRRGS